MKTGLACWKRERVRTEVEAEARCVWTKERRRREDKKEGEFIERIADGEGCSGGREGFKPGGSDGAI
jgi:hypothetical protein